MPEEKKQLTIIMPVFDDWECLAKQIARVDDVMKGGDYDIRILAVNDCSSLACPFTREQFAAMGAVRHVDILNLVRNVGHQRAITLGLAFAQHHLTCDYVVVMDGDGEDRAEDLPALLEEARRYSDRIVFAQRAKRSEGMTFRIFYRVYRLLFRLLTGTPISYGNFCVIPFSLVKRIVYVSELWNHFASGIIRSGVPVVTIPTRRGTRFSGRPKMNFTSLVILGLSAISVSLDRAAVRLILASAVMIVTAGIAIAGVVAVRLLTDLAIPGWATYVALSLFVILVQGFTISVFLIFLVLNYRTQKHFVPYYDYSQFVLDSITVL